MILIKFLTMMLSMMNIDLPYKFNDKPIDEGFITPSGELLDVFKPVIRYKHDEQ